MARTGNAYCDVVDLLLGDISTSALLDPQKYVNDASDEIDSKIGFVYITPVSINAPTPRPVVLLLKRICSHLASGRLIMAATLSVEGDKLHAYGESLVTGAQMAITEIVKGNIVLSGVTNNILGPGTDAVKLGIISNKDAESAVDAYYDRIANPRYVFPGTYGGPYSGPYSSPYGPPYYYAGNEG